MAKIKNKLAYLLALITPAFSLNLLADDPETAESAEEAKKAASGSLSVGAIAAAVAAAAALAGSSGGDSSPEPTPAPTPAPTVIEEYVEDVVVDTMVDQTVQSETTVSSNIAAVTSLVNTTTDSDVTSTATATRATAAVDASNSTATQTAVFTRMVDGTETYTATGTDFNLRNPGTSATPLSSGDARLNGGSHEVGSKPVYIIELTRTVQVEEEYIDTETYVVDDAVPAGVEDYIIEVTDTVTGDPYEVDLIVEAETTVDVTTSEPVNVSVAGTKTVTQTATRTSN